MPTGERIKELRKKRGLSQSALGEKVNTDSTSVSRWETNRSIPGQKYIGKLASALGTSTDYLLCETNDPESPGEIHPLTILAASGANDDNRLVVSNKDVYANLPNTPEGIELMRLFLEMAKGKQTEHQAVMA